MKEDIRVTYPLKKIEKTRLWSKPSLVVLDVSETKGSGGTISNDGPGTFFPDSSK